MSDKMELKAWKMLAEIRSRFLTELKRRADIDAGSPDLTMAKISAEYLSNPEKWDYCGMLSKEDRKVMEVLEYLLNDQQEEVRKYR